uniref:Uncharacterized protein n=1 Tax=Anguilla anguilla TaxID=7936 RepID=A0A0E9VZ03_ANGAN
MTTTFSIFLLDIVFSISKGALDFMLQFSS